MRSRKEECFVANANTLKVNNLELLYIQKKHTSVATLPLTFVYILYSLHIVFIYKKPTRAVSVSQLYRFCIACASFVCARNIHRQFLLASCISFAQFVHCLYIQKTYISIFRLFSACTLYKFVQFVHFLCRNLMYIFCRYIHYHMNF